MTPGVSYRQAAPQGLFDAIVIGSGIGGLGCAAGLARYGSKRVLVLERHYRIGGFTHTFTRPGYEWDVGVHYLGQLGERGTIRAVFDRLTDGSLRWAPLPAVYDRIVLGNRSYDLVAGGEALIEKLSGYFPSERDAISGYVALCRTVMRASQTYYFHRALGGDPPRQSTFAAYADRTTREVLLELTRNEELISVLTGQWGDYGLPPAVSSFAMHASLVAHYFGGAWYPVGGASAIARAFAPVIEHAGGVLCHSIEVKQILVENGRTTGVVLADDAVVRAPLVISDAGIASTYGALLPEAHVPTPLRAALDSVRASGSHVCVYLGFKQTDTELGLNGTNLWLFPDGRHDSNVAQFVADFAAPLPLVYASFPSAKDPSWAQRYPGRATVTLIAMCPWEAVEKWQTTRWMKRGEEYEQFKAAFTQRILEVAFKVLPQLKGKVDVCEVSTPLTTRHFSGHPQGELYGLEHSPNRFRVPLRAQTPVPGLFLTGADLASAGVAGALIGGALTAGAIEGPEVLRKILQKRA